MTSFLSLGRVIVRCHAILSSTLAPLHPSLNPQGVKSRAYGRRGSAHSTSDASSARSVRESSPIRSRLRLKWDFVKMFELEILTILFSNMCRRFDAIPQLETDRNPNQYRSLVCSQAITKRSADADHPARHVYRSAKVTKHGTIR